MKKIFIILLISVFVLGLVGCETERARQIRIEADIKRIASERITVLCKPKLESFKLADGKPFRRIILSNVQGGEYGIQHNAQVFLNILDKDTVYRFVLRKKYRNHMCCGILCDWVIAEVYDGDKTIYTEPIIPAIDIITISDEEQGMPPKIYKRLKEKYPQYFPIGQKIPDFVIDFGVSSNSWKDFQKVLHFSGPGLRYIKFRINGYELIHPYTCDYSITLADTVYSLKGEKLKGDFRKHIEVFIIPFQSRVEGTTITRYKFNGKKYSNYWYLFYDIRDQYESEVGITVVICDDPSKEAKVKIDLQQYITLLDAAMKSRIDFIDYESHWNLNEQPKNGLFPITVTKRTHLWPMTRKIIHTGCIGFKHYEKQVERLNERRKKYTRNK